MRKDMLIIFALSITSGIILAQENRIEKVGSIGIGTTNPKNALTIKTLGQGWDGMSIFRTENSANLDIYSTYNGSDDEQTGSFGYGVRPVDDAWQIWNRDGYQTNWINLVTVLKNGNFGIGNRSPLSRLHVEGGTEPRSVQTLFPDSYTTGSPVSGLRFTWYNDSWELRAHRSDNTPIEAFSIARNGIEYFKISNAGNVGIGTTDTKGYKLAVAGNVIAESINVKVQTQWPDYVFNTHHKLQNLPDLEKFIKKHKHLPDLPSAQEVVQDGINLGEMNGKLLKKIEELTLHLIQKNKEISELKKSNLRIDVIEEKLNTLLKRNR